MRLGSTAGRGLLLWLGLRGDGGGGAEAGETLETDLWGVRGCPDLSVLTLSASERFELSAMVGRKTGERVISKQFKHFMGDASY